MPSTSRYLSTVLPAAQDASGSYFPDTVVEPLMAKAVGAAPAVFAAHVARPEEFALLKPGAVIPGPSISYDRSKKLILEALTDFDPVLAQKAKGIFDAGFDAAAKQNFIEDRDATLAENDLRWRLREVEPGKTAIMRCLPGGAERTAFDPPNPNRRAVIQFEYDNTINSTIYLAHELGHALADDYARENGNKPGDNPKHMDELQAYFVQHILYKHLEKHPDPALAQAAQQHFKTTMARSLYDFPVADSALRAQQGAKNITLETALGPDWKKYEPAQKAAADIEMLRSGDSGKHMGALAEKNLNDTVARFHSRPVSIMIASGLVNQLEIKDAAERHRLAETVLGGKGPTDIPRVLKEAGIKTRADMDALAESAVAEVAAQVSAAPKAGLASASVASADPARLKQNFAPL